MPKALLDKYIEMIEINTHIGQNKKHVIIFIG